MRVFSLVLLLLFYLASYLKAQNVAEWYPAQLLQKQTKEGEILDSPKAIKTTYGEAAYFDGNEDAIIINEMPLKNIKAFTLEMIFKPDTAAPFEQRIVHIGEVSGDRVLLEIRAVNDSWYFDGFAASGKNKKALIDSTLTHPLNQWHHVAFVVEPNQLRTYVDTTLELSQKFSFSPIMTGKTSIGMRLNNRSFFKGSIYKIRITPGVVPPENFIKK